MKNHPAVVALILAGGVGNRIQADRPKQYIEFAGESIIHHTLKAFQGIVDEILVVCQDEWKDYLHDYNTCPAGATGYESLCNGINALSTFDGDTMIMIHDAVRPLISKEVILDNLRIARQYGNAVAAYEIYETLFHAPDGASVQSMTRREGMFRAQTPHTFQLNTLKQMISMAHERCIADAQSACTLAAQLGFEVHLSKGSILNFKITTAEDLALYQSIVQHTHDV